MGAKNVSIFDFCVAKYTNVSYNYKTVIQY